MRDIRFRGKATETGEWVYGWLEIHLIDGELDKKEKRYYVTAECMDKIGKVYRCKHQVTPESVGQYTEIKEDKNKEIYEGDIVVSTWYNYVEPICDITGVVKFLPSRGAYCIIGADVDEIEELNGMGAYVWQIEVVGNIHDNPDLLNF